MSGFVASRLQNRGVHYGWVVVAVTFLTMLVTAGSLGAPGVLLVPLEKEFGWNVSEISSAFALRLVLYGLLGPFAAAFLNRFGVRKVVTIALLIILAGLLASVGMNSVWQLVVFWGLLVGVETGLTAMVLGATIATRWFVHRRGTVMGVLAASSATGQLLFLPLLAAVTESFGWRTTVLMVCAALAVTIVAVIAFMRNAPSDVGQLPFGSDEPLPSTANRDSNFRALLLTPIVVLKDVARVPTFWILFGTFFVCGASTNGLIQTHFVTLCGDFGILPVGAAGILAVMGIFDFFGTIGSGWLSDRFDNNGYCFGVTVRVDCPSSPSPSPASHSTACHSLRSSMDSIGSRLFRQRLG
jgi:MFS family permease